MALISLCHHIYNFHLAMPNKPSEMEHSGTLGKSKLFPENELQRENSALKDGSRQCPKCSVQINGSIYLTICRELRMTSLSFFI